jgi:hypothetical protein
MHMQTHMLLSIGALIGDNCEQGHHKVLGPTIWSSTRTTAGAEVRRRGRRDGELTLHW